MAPSVSQLELQHSPQSPDSMGPPYITSSQSSVALNEQQSSTQKRFDTTRRHSLTHDRGLSQASIPLSHDIADAEYDDEQDSVPYVFPDFQALKDIFAKDDYKTVTVTGFEIYIVEQWACERRYCTVIASYTGDSMHKIKAGCVRLPRDPSKWSGKVRRFLGEIEQSGSRLKKTDHGYMFITSLSSFPSHLNLIPVSCGCILDIWDLFKVNVNLRRMNCAGRSALFLCSPSDVCEDKFRQIYKTHPKVEITYAVKEIVTLVQICLVDFKLLDPLFVDGLLCNKTEEKIMDWWNMFGSLYYGITPKDGVLGPTTLSAILGFVLSCHYRLDMASVDFPKEPFNYFSFRVNVGKFQKAYNLTRTWYLDPITVDKLFRVTSKTSTSDISKLKKVVKSTVQDISGKLSSEQSAKEVLTADLEKAIKYFSCSPRLEYLWFGKGDCRDLTQFDYYISRSPQAGATSTLKSGVGKIRGFPKRLQGDDLNLAFTPPALRKKDQGKELDEACLTDDAVLLCEGFSEACPQPPICDPREITILTDDETFKRSLRRRLSFPYLAVEINSSQLGYENHAVPLSSHATDESLLRRSKSFTLVENSVLKWESPVVVPETVARKVRNVERCAFRNKLDWEQYCKEMKHHYLQSEDAKSLVFKLTQRSRPVFHQCDLKIQADERFHLKIDDIEATGARLEYEMRLLSTRVRDTQDSVDNFVRKVESLEAAISAACPLSKAIATAVKSELECEGTLSSYSIDKERIGKVWRMIEQFSTAQWLTNAFMSFKSRCGFVTEDFSVETADEKQQSTFVIDEKVKQS